MGELKGVERKGVESGGTGREGRWSRCCAGGSLEGSPGRGDTCCGGYGGLDGGIMEPAVVLYTVLTETWTGMRC